MEFSKICVIGLGYIGLPTASTFAMHGLQVVGVDTNPEIIKILRNGGVHISEPGLQQLVEQSLASGHLRVTTVPETADAFIIAVPTPFYEHEQGTYNGQSYRLADMRAVTSATNQLFPTCRGVTWWCWSLHRHPALPSTWSGQSWKGRV